MTFSQHVVVGIVGNGEDMWGHFRLSLALVATNDMVIVHWKPFVGIDGDTEETGVGVDQEKLVARLQVVDNRCLKFFVNESLVLVIDYDS